MKTIIHKDKKSGRYYYTFENFRLMTLAEFTSNQFKIHQCDIDVETLERASERCKKILDSTST